MRFGDGPGDTATDRLDSWKEIASFLRRGITTVQRWEVEEALPIHRQAHAKRGTVYAFKSELAAWRDSREAAPSARAPATFPSRGRPRPLFVATALLASALGLSLILRHVAASDRD